MSARPVGGSTFRRIPPADTPQVNVCVNASRPGRVHFSIGSGGMDGYDLEPEFAEMVADDLLAAAAAARRAGGEG